MSIVVIANTEFAMLPRPTVNMWWLHTPQPINPMTIPEKITKWYPKSGLREKVGMISETMPMAGNIRM